MTTIRRIVLFFLLGLLAHSETAMGSHSMGSDLTYHCLGNNQYEVTLSFYRDCRGILAAPYADIFVSSSCYPDTFIRIYPIPGTGQEISQVCSTEVTTCNGGTYTGIQEYIYRGVVTLQGPCADWSFSYDLCCRNAAITNVLTPDTNRIYVAATLNNTVVNCNSSPVFSNRPVPFVCIGQQFCFNHGAYDADGDSLAYQLITPLDTAGVPVTYASPFSASNPLSSNPAFSFNPLTGDICMSPTQLQVTIMAVLVKEYRNGVLIGTVERDIQVTVINCTNVIPTLSGINGSTDFSLTVCAGEQACFNIVSADTNTQQHTYITWDFSIPGAVFTTIPGSRESAEFCWIPDLSDVSTVPHCFTATVTDDNCPYPGYQVYSYCITVQSVSVNAGPNQTVGCNATTTLQASAGGGSGNYTYQWNTGQTTSAITAGPGTYIVTASDGHCTSNDTVVVNSTINNPVASFLYSKTCTGTSVSFTNQSTIGSGTITAYSWTFGDGSTSTATNPVHVYTTTGTYNVTLVAQGSSGCVDTLVLPVIVSLNQPIASFSGPAVCLGQQTNFTDLSTSPNSPITSWSWNFGNGQTSTYPVPATTYLAPGNYNVTLTVTNADGCTSTVTNQISVNSPPVADAGSPVQVCSGSSVTLTATGGITYQWSPGNLSSSSVTVFPTQTTAYHVVVSDNNGCTATDSVSVTVRPEPLFGITNNRRICSGTSTTIGVSTNTPLTYFWTPTGATTQQITVSPSATTYYVVVVTDQYGCTGSDSTRISVINSPNATATTTPVACSGGNTGTASVAVTGGTSPYFYSWSSGLGSASALSGLAAGNYTVVVSDYNNCKDTVVATVTQPPPIVPNAASTPALCAGSSGGTASVSPTGGSPGYAYQWSVSGATSAAISNLTAGSYSVTISDAQGCTATTSVQVTDPSPLVMLTSSSPVSCYGSATGSATVSVSGGTPSLSYSWSPVSGSQSTLQNIPAGNYQVVVTDANSCTASATVSVTQPTQLMVSVTSIDATCGLADGAASVMATAGSGPYSYLWSTGETAASVSGLAAGNYVVTVTDANGCTISSSFNVNTTSAPSVIAATLNSVSCNGGNDGAAYIQYVTGNGPVNFQWPDGSQNDTVYNLTAGIYPVTAIDANGCSSTDSVLIPQPPQLLAAVTSVPALCQGASSGSLTAVASGGIPGYSYSWNSGSYSGPLLNGVPAGNYSLMVTDGNGCTISVQTSVSEPLPLSVSVTATPALCAGSSTGTATALPQNGFGVLTYAWQPGGSVAQTATGLAAGNYTVLVTDQHGCTGTASTQITAPAPLAVNFNAIPPLCHGQSNGAATAIISGGTSGYQYFWAPNGQTTATINSIPSGTYHITVSDANGCVVNDTVQVNQPSPLALTISATPNTCGISDGTASVNVIGGTAAYTYQWASNASLASTASGLSPGTYSVTVTDANGCSSSISTTVVTTGFPTVSAAVINDVTCPGAADGTAHVSTVSGNGPFSFLWSTGSSNDTVFSLPAGNYPLTITDANGCIARDTVTVTAPPALIVTATTVSALCNGAASGTVSAAASGGTPGYSYSWNSGAFSGAAIQSLPADTYTVVVTDVRGCTATGQSIVSEPLPLIATASATPTLCTGNSNGTVSVAVQNGYGVLSYNWQPGGYSISSVSGLAAGNYTVIVTDANGCTTSTSALVAQPPALSITITKTGPSCYGQSNGVATVNPSGGVGGYSYLWAPTGSQSASTTGIPSGQYSVLVTDANGCTITGYTTVTQPALLTLSCTSTPATCGVADGSITSVPAGGTQPYSYAWSGQSSTAASVSGLAAGNYSVTVTDANGCTRSTTAAVVNIGAPQLSVAVLDQVSCFGGTDGSAYAQSLTGNGPFTYSWSNGGVNDTSSNLMAGDYVLTVTDANGCVDVDSVRITQPTLLTVNIGATPASCHGVSDGSATVSIQGGSASYSCLWSPVGLTSTTVNGLTAGNYSVLVTDANGCTATSFATVTQPPSNLLSTASGQVSCHGGADGYASVRVLNNTAIARYEWFPGSLVDDTVFSLSAGNYFVVVTDSAGCVDTANVAITEPPAIVLQMAATDVACHGDSTGSVSVVATGGTPAYSYEWSPTGSTDDNVIGLPIGMYRLEVTDRNGCVSIDSIQVSEPAALVVATSSTPATCGVADGSATAIPSGGIPPYAYEWDPGTVTDSVISNILAGNYDVLVTDAHGCTLSSSALVSNIGAPTVSAAAADVSCYGGNDGVAYVNAVTGNGPFDYSWSSGSVGDTVYGLPSGHYEVQVRDVNGCIAIDSVSISEPPLLATTVSAQSTTCFDGSDGAVHAVVTGGTPSYSFLWPSTGSVGPDVQSLAAGYYTVVVTDALGCTASAGVTVGQPAPLVMNTGSHAVSCNGLADGYAFVSVTGGSGSLILSWMNHSSFNDTLTAIPAGNYPVAAMDSNGCSIIDTVTVSEPDPIQLTLSNDTISCSGSSDGLIALSVAGGNGGYSYHWLPGNQTVPTITNLTAGIYEVLVLDIQGCTSSGTAAVISPSPLELSVVGPPVLCIGQSAELIAQVGGGTSPYTFQWSNGMSNDTVQVSPASTTSYSVTVIDANGCSLSPVQLQVPVYPPLQLAVTNPPSICEGDSVVISALASGGNGGPFNYTWTNGGQTGSSLMVHPLRDSTFEVAVNDGCSTPALATSLVVVNPLPLVEFTPEQIQGCSPVQVNFNTVNNVPQGSVFDWDLDDQTVSTSANPAHTYVVPGYYDVSLSITTPAGCTAADTVKNAVHVFGYPTALFQQSSETVSAFAPTVSLFDQSIDALTWRWDFGDGTFIADDRNPVHVYADSGTYQIQLIVTGDGGCPDTVYGTVRVEPEFSIYIPNAFTPNGDGINDGFIAYGKNIISYEMWIMDRWGMEIYHAVDFDRPWDGTYYGNQQPCQNDVYEYIIDVTDFSGRKHRYLGHVTLVR